MTIFKCTYCEKKFKLFGYDYIEFSDVITNNLFVCEKCEEPYRNGKNFGELHLKRNI